MHHGRLSHSRISSSDGAIARSGGASELPPVMANDGSGLPDGSVTGLDLAAAEQLMLGHYCATVAGLAGLGGVC